MSLLDDLDLYSNLLLSLGTHKKERPLKPIEVAKLINTLKSETKESWNKVASRLGVGIDQVKSFRNLLHLPEQVHYAIGYGDTNEESLAFTTANIVSELKNMREKELLCKFALSNKLTKDETERIIQLKKQSPDEAIEECVNKVLNLRPVFEKGYVIVTLVKDETLRKLVSMSEARTIELNKLIKEIMSRIIKHGVVESVLVRNKTVLLTVDEEAYKSLLEIQTNKHLLFNELFDYLIVEGMQVDLRCWRTYHGDYNP